jgi:hypothetical protein
MSNQAQELINVVISENNSKPRLEKDKGYCLLITNVSNNKKTIFSGPARDVLHIHRIWFKDNAGKKIEAEYLTATETQNVFMPGTMAQFVCVKNGAFIDEIEPIPEWLKGEVQPCEKPKEEDIAKVIKAFKDEPVTIGNYNNNQSLHNVASEDAIRQKYEQQKLIALQCAKDIVCAQISAGAKLNADEVKAEVTVLQKKFYELIINI